MPFFPSLLVLGRWDQEARPRQRALVRGESVGFRRWFRALGVVEGVRFWVVLLEGCGYAGAPGAFCVAGVYEDCEWGGGED